MRVGAGRAAQELQSSGVPYTSQFPKDGGLGLLWHRTARRTVAELCASNWLRGCHVHFRVRFMLTMYGGASCLSLLALVAPGATLRGGEYQCCFQGMAGH